MAQPELDFFKKRALLLKAETVEGTDSNPVGATDGFRLFDGTSSTEFDKVERPVDRPFFGGDPFVVANRRAKIEGDFELYPPAVPGTDDADCGKILLPGGMAVVKDAVGKVTRYNPISSGIPSASAHWYHVRRLMKVTGARVALSAIAVEIGQRFKGKASIQGDYTEWETADSPTVVLPTKVPVVASARNMRTKLSTLVRGATKTTDATPLDDLLVWAKSLSIDFGSDLKHKEYSSKSVNGISDRKPTFSLKLATTDITNDFDPLWVRDNGIVLLATVQLFETEGAPSSVLTGRYSEIGVRCQIENVIAEEIDGDDGWTITGPCIPSDTGGDEFYIGFGETP